METLYGEVFIPLFALPLESGVNFSGFCKKQPENEIPATFFAAVDEILKYSHPIISRFEPVAQV